MRLIFLDAIINLVNFAYLHKQGGIRMGIANNANLKAVHYYQEAQKMLEKKDLLKFVENIAIAKVMAESNEDLLAKVTFLKIQGLIEFNQHKGCLDSIAEALQFNKGDELIRLKHYEGIVYGFLGESKKAVNILKELVNQTTEGQCLLEVYLTLAWVYLVLEKEAAKDTCLELGKHYLDLVHVNFDTLSDTLKRKLLNNYNVYYYRKGQYNEAIEVLNQAIQYCEKKDLPKIYNAIAEALLQANPKECLSLDEIREYLDKAEVIASEYDDNIQLGKSFDVRGTAYLKGDQLFKSLDAYYLAFEHFKKAEAYPYAFDSLIKINQVIHEYKIDALQSLGENFKEAFKGTAYYKQT